MDQGRLDFTGTKRNEPARPSLHQLPGDLMALLTHVPPEQLTGRSARELKNLVEHPLVAAAMHKFKGTIIGIEGKVGLPSQENGQPTPPIDEPLQVEQIELF